MHHHHYKYVSIVSAVAVLLLLGIYMWMTYRSVTNDIRERAGNQLPWAMFYESYNRAEVLSKGDTLSLPQLRGNLSLASSVEGMNDVLSHKYHSETSLDTVALFVDSLLSVAHINRDVTIQEIDTKGRVLRQNNNRCNSWSLLTKPVIPDFHPLFHQSVHTSVCLHLCHFLHLQDGQPFRSGGGAQQWR